MAGRGPRLRLVSALVLVAAVPTTAAAWSFLRNAEQNALDRNELSLAAALAPATAALEQEAVAAGTRARRVARSRPVQRAFATRDLRRLRTLARARPGIRFEVGERRLGRSPAGIALEATVAVVSGRRTAGRVVTSAPVDRRLRRRLLGASGLRPGHLLVRSGLPGRPAGARDLRLGGVDYRAVAGPTVGGVRLVAVSPRAELERSFDRRRRNVLLAVLATLLTVGFAAYAVPPALARDRVARRGLALIGDALAATHNARALLPVILDAAVEATGAAGGVLLDGGTQVARAGEGELRGQPLRLVVAPDEGDQVELLLYPRAGGFGRDAREIGDWLAAQAGIALENARLHRVAREQAVTDPLTLLPNRRRFMDALTAELHRSGRFGSPLALVLADLDDFKRINDRFGHEVGDEVLRRTADVLGETLREVDVPARIGGEEFAVLLPETELAGGERLAERIRAGVEALEIRTAEGETVTVTASFGVAEQREGWGATELLRAADRALYRAKLTGKNRVAAGAPDRV